MSDEVKNYEDEVEEFIDTLDYNPDTVLTDAAANEGRRDYKEEITDNLINGVYYVYKREHKTDTKGNVDLGYVESLNTGLYPGCLVLCNQHLVDNKPDIVELPRKAYDFGISLPNAESFDSKISKKDLDKNISKAVSEWWKNNENGNIPCNYNYKCIEIFNSQQLELELGMDTKSSDFKLNIDFKSIDKRTARDWLGIFEQPYFTAYINNMTSSIDTLNCEGNKCTTVNLLKKRGVSNECPIGIVKSITYGRKIFAHFHSNDVSLNLKSKLDLFLNKNGVSAESKNKAEYEEIKKNLEVEMLVQGGATASCATINLDKLTNVIEENMSFTKEQRCVPISYSVRYLKNGGQTQAVVKKNSTYDELTVERHNQITLRLKQTGGYVGKMSAEWDEYRYVDDNGNLYPNGPKVEHRVWDKGNTTCTSNEIRTLSGNVKNLHLRGSVFKNINTKFTRWLARLFKTTVVQTVFDQIVEVKGSEITLQLCGRTMDEAYAKLYYN